MKTVEISGKWTAGNGGAPEHTALNLSGSGKIIATVQGPIEPIIASEDHFGCDMIGFEGKTWAIRDILRFARNGERGLVVVA